MPKGNRHLIVLDDESDEKLQLIVDELNRRNAFAQVTKTSVVNGLIDAAVHGRLSLEDQQFVPDLLAPSATPRRERVREAAEVTES